jgi:hypothetical protein
VKSARPKSSFTLKTNNGRLVNILSVSSEGQLLVGQAGARQLHVYSAHCSHVTSITLPDDDDVWDAVWTRRGNIVYSEWRSGKVVTVSQSGDVIHQTHVLDPSYLSVSTYNVTYLISGYKSVYQSTDEGLTWGHVFTAFKDWQCWQVIQVSTDNNIDALWTLVALDLAEYWRLRVYTVDKRRAVGDNATWRDVTLPSHETVDIRHSRLAYDGYTSIFVTDGRNTAVHVWSVSGQYDRQLVSYQQLSSLPLCVAVDTQRHVMYVGHDKDRVGVLELTYEPL